MMTNAAIAFAEFVEFVEKGPDNDLLREMFKHVVERVMAFDVENLCQTLRQACARGAPTQR